MNSCQRTKTLNHSKILRKKTVEKSQEQMKPKNEDIDPAHSRIITIPTQSCHCHCCHLSCRKVSLPTNFLHCFALGRHTANNALWLPAMTFTALNWVGSQWIQNHCIAFKNVETCSLHYSVTSDIMILQFFAFLHHAQSADQRCLVDSTEKTIALISSIAHLHTWCSITLHCTFALRRTRLVRVAQHGTALWWLWLAEAELLSKQLTSSTLPHKNIQI